LQRRGAEVVIASRTRERADKLASALSCKAVDWGTRHNFWVDLLINCTPVGMHPNVDETPYDKHYLKPSMVVFDTVYNPESTLLVKDARQRSCTVITGVDMFIRQAALQFKLFTEEDAPNEVMRDALKRTIDPAKH
jgi:3-dehydroquinate dehydratase / shikimate dehydrogenase